MPNAPKNTPAPSAQSAADTARDALANLAAGEIDFDTASLMRYAPNSTLSKEAAVLILFGALDDVPSASSEFDGCPDSVGENLDVLLLVRADTLRSHAGQPAFPGGKIDPEDYDQARAEGVPVGRIAALREAVEETGLDPAGVEILGELPTLPLAVSDFRVTPVLGWWDSPTQVSVVDANESALIARVPVRDLLNPANRHTAYVKRGRITHKTPAFEVAHTHGDTRDEFTVWGFTAIVLDKIFDALAWTVPWDASVLKPAPA
ncbi:MAG: CoA pyrophosphatase [Rothia sp. (in: high G+C Gram-positive bacteria)]|uniref:NUDIX hydrolase n=1 Tax=Rothia sp. (in: high G+C Gram-positive bacteria) TaxID=1885016 RepID=UPI0026DB904B|nr:CoA pyrophosphatase [Rothia sp. (in: high G+C Gram-positive bacteria)]MDO4883597.1 CoA pyrophosphatase [Rothia sp. (in: high G+C Gram-positive bacteria)]